MKDIAVTTVVLVAMMLSVAKDSQSAVVTRPQSKTMITASAESKGRAPCPASALTISVGWGGEADGSVGGGIFLQNNSSVECTLQGTPKVQLIDAQGKILPTIQTSIMGIEGSSGVLKPRQGAGVISGWHNWCKAVPKGGLRLKLVLPGKQSQLIAPIMSKNRPLLNVAPRCTDAKRASYLTVSPIFTQ